METPAVRLLRIQDREKLLQIWEHLPVRYLVFTFEWPYMGKCNICPLKLLREDVIWLLKLAERERGAAIILLVGDNLFFFCHLWIFLLKCFHWRWRKNFFWRFYLLRNIKVKQNVNSKLRSIKAFILLHFLSHCVRLLYYSKYKTIGNFKFWKIKYMFWSRCMVGWKWW